MGGEEGKGREEGKKGNRDSKVQISPEQVGGKNMIQTEIKICLH